MLRDEVALYSRLTGRDGQHTPIGIIGAYLDGYEKGKSEQQEIIHCIDCKHHWTHKCMDSMPIERCDLEQTFYAPEVDYCSLAERREGAT